MIVMEDFYLSQALFRTQEILDNFTNERSMQVRLKALTENGRIEKIKNGKVCTDDESFNADTDRKYIIVILYTKTTDNPQG